MSPGATATLCLPAVNLPTAPPDPTGPLPRAVPSPGMWQQDGAQRVGVSRLSCTRVEGDGDHSSPGAQGRGKASRWAGLSCPQQVPVCPSHHLPSHTHGCWQQSLGSVKPGRAQTQAPCPQGLGQGQRACPPPRPDMAPILFAGTTRKRCGAWPSTSTTRSSPRARTTGPSSFATAWSTSM